MLYEFNEKKYNDVRVYRAGILAGSNTTCTFLLDLYIAGTETATVLARITNASPRVRCGMNDGGRKEDGSGDRDVAGVSLVNVLSEADLRRINLDEGGYYGEDDFVSLRDIEYVDGELWFTVHTGPRNIDKDIGWRYGYDREKSNVYMKDLRNNGNDAITLIYSY